MSEMASPSVPPTLPPEIQRLIFRITARAFKESRRNLELVASWVRDWVLPIRYEILTDENYSEFNFESKGKHVRQLLLITNHRVAECLERCTGLENLAVWVNLNSQYPNIINLIYTLPLRQLSMRLDVLFNWGRVDFKTYCFPQLTHLEILNTLEHWSDIEDIALLPNLTHLAYNHPPVQEIIRGSLKNCAKLRVLVLLHSGSVGTLPRDEKRVVIGLAPVEDWELDWFSGAEGGEDFWARAERIVVSRYSSEDVPCND